MNCWSLAPRSVVQMHFCELRKALGHSSWPRAWTRAPSRSTTAALVTALCTGSSRRETGRRCHRGGGPGFGLLRNSRRSTSRAGRGSVQGAPEEGVRPERQGPPAQRPPPSTCTPAPSHDDALLKALGSHLREGSALPK